MHSPPATDIAKVIIKAATWMAHWIFADLPWPELMSGEFCISSWYSVVFMAGARAG